MNGSELRERLCSADPAASLAPLPSDQLTRLMEDTMAQPADQPRTMYWRTAVAAAAVLAVAGGLRRYLGEQDAHADEVVWMVPVNLKPHADNLPSELGNYFALVFLPMRLDQHDRRTRVREMHKQMGRIKASDEAALTFGLQRIVSLSPSQVARMLTDFFANKAVGVLTNVPGPRAAMTLLRIVRGSSTVPPRCAMRSATSARWT